MKNLAMALVVVAMVCFSGNAFGSIFKRTPESFTQSGFSIVNVQIKCNDAGEYYLLIQGEKIPGDCTTPGCMPPAVYVGADTVIELISMSADTEKGEIIAYFPEGTELYPGCYTLFVVDKFNGKENPSRKDTFVFCAPDGIFVGGGGE